MTELLTPEEAAARLKLSRATIYAWIGARRIPVVKFSGKRGGAVRIEAAALERLIDEHRRPAWTPRKARRESA